VIVDYHLHLRDPDERIAHRVDAVEPFVETPAHRGVDELGFTEHVYYFRQTRALLGSGVRVRVLRLPDTARARLPARLDGRRREEGVWARLSVEEVWRRYFGALAELASSGHVDVLAHPDLPKIFGRRPAGVVEYPGLDGVALEISTNGRYKPVRELYPDRAFLEAARAPITLGSDAHVPANVGRDLHEAVELARAVGYETVTVFEGRRARQEPLG
jgi:histidinol-phosphatase (PHP family)